MAIAFDNATSTSSTTATSLTFSHTINSNTNGILFVGVLTGSASDLITGVTYAGVSMTRLDIQVVGADNTVYLYYLLAPSTGANNVVISASSSVFLDGTASSYTGANQSGQPDNWSKGSSASATSYTGTVTTVADNCWLIMCGRKYNNGTPSAGTNSTLRASSSYMPIVDTNAAQTPAGSKSVQINWTGTASNVGGIAASFKPYGAASGPANLKTWDGVVKASIKTLETVAIASVKSWNGIT
jgi:hypothetical protein